MRAEPLAQWLDCFAADNPVRILAVQQDDCLIAALPLIKDRRGPFSIGKLPGGDLCSVGDLLWDPSQEASNQLTGLQSLAASACNVDCSLLQLDAIFPQTKRWKTFIDLLEAKNATLVASHRGMTGMIDIQGSWDAYFAARSRNHRRHMRVIHNRAISEGRLQLVSLANPPQEQIEALLCRGFAVEDQSWKGQGGTSTLRTPGALSFFVEQGKLLSASGHLLLTFLVLNDHDIAFEYGWQSKGIYHSLKVGYDENYRHLSPGQLLRYEMMQELFNEKELHAVDYLGPLSDATAKWSTRTYPVSKLFIASRLSGRLALSIYRRLRKRAAPAYAPTECPSDSEPQALTQTAHSANAQ